METYISFETALMLLAVAHVASVMLLLAISQAAIATLEELGY